MKDILDKISSYNIFNYLLPGVLFVVLSKALTSYDFSQEDNLLGAFLYYFFGMIISRFGSIVLEPILKRFQFVKFRDYSKYILASKEDNKIELLSEVNNTYRTLVSMIVIVLFLKIYNMASVKYNLDNGVAASIVSIFVLVLFLFSYKKQTNFIGKRIDVHGNRGNVA